MPPIAPATFAVLAHLRVLCYAGPDARELLPQMATSSAQAQDVPVDLLGARSLQRHSGLPGGWATRDLADHRRTTWNAMTCGTFHSPPQDDWTDDPVTTP
jgi:hypothetical protein